MSGNFTDAPDRIPPLNIVRRDVYVARSKDNGKFACEGRETGMGKLIEETSDVTRAMFSTSPGGIMQWMGGHYRRFDAVALTISYELGTTAAYPSEKEMWPDA